MVESGTFYSLMVDPFLKNMRKRVAYHVENGQAVIDVACGTGAQVFELSAKVRYAAGIDLSESMINKAEEKQQKKNITNVLFRVDDATGRLNFDSRQFDVAILSLALHQFSPKDYPNILKEMKRVAERFILVDYAIPLPGNFFGTGSKVAEFLAGREHFRNFRKYGSRGGLPVILADNKIKIEREEFFAKGVFQLAVCSRL
jgi:SAM-dependent methyltransferase